MNRALRGCGLALAVFAACSHEIDSGPPPASRDRSPASLAAAPPGATPLESDGFQTHLYSERDADVFSRRLEVCPEVGEQSAQGAHVKAVHVEIGEWVQAGQVLATLDEDAARIQVEAAEAAAEDAARRFERLKNLREKNLVATADLDAAYVARKDADAKLKCAQLALARTRVRAPFDGLVSRRYVKAGERVGDERPLFRITAPMPLRARLLVPEARVAGVRPGTPFHLTGADGGRAEARVLLVGPTVDPASGTREVILEVAEPGVFLPGAAAVATPLPADGSAKP